jgi:hypothetical protein
MEKITAKAEAEVMAPSDPERGTDYIEDQIED